MRTNTVKTCEFDKQFCRTVSYLLKMARLINLINDLALHGDAKIALYTKQLTHWNDMIKLDYLFYSPRKVCLE